MNIQQKNLAIGIKTMICQLMSVAIAHPWSKQVPKGDACPTQWLYRLSTLGVLYSKVYTKECTVPPGSFRYPLGALLALPRRHRTRTTRGTQTATQAARTYTCGFTPE